MRTRKCCAPAHVAVNDRATGPFADSYVDLGRRAIGFGGGIRNHSAGGMVREENYMNRNQVKGAAKDVAGKAQETLGKATGSANQQAKGLAKQVEGKVQKGIGNAQENMKDAERDAERESKH